MATLPGSSAWTGGAAVDEGAFLAACRQVMEAPSRGGGIGTLGEKTLHAALKLCLEPREGCREVLVGRFVADILNEEGVTEIQTSGFGRLREKLAFYLEAYPVRLVYPVAGIKWLVNVGPDGAAAPRRKSPKPEGPWQILPELAAVKEYRGHPGLRLLVPVLEVEEYRLRDGKGRRGYTRWERMPVRLLDQTAVEGPQEAGKLLPPGLLEEFTAKEFQKAGRFSPMQGSLALSAAKALGTVERIGNRGRAYLYRRAE